VKEKETQQRFGGIQFSSRAINPEHVEKKSVGANIFGPLILTL